MIPRAYITEWREHAPWGQSTWVEQDLVISRAIVEIFANDDLAQRLAFRGGTALYKLHLLPPARYSEDIDLVQTRAEPIGATFDIVRSVLDPWLGEPRRVLKDGRVNLVYRFLSEEDSPVQRRLKVEINSREHFAELGWVQVPFRIENRWFAGEAQVTTFHPDELLATKLRALYQRRKGRDLFDLAHALQRQLVDPEVLLRCFHRYMADGGHAVSRAQFEANLAQKAGDAAFRGDIKPLLRPEFVWDFAAALETVQRELIARLPGDRWKGSGDDS